LSTTLKAIPSPALPGGAAAVPAAAAVAAVAAAIPVADACVWAWL